MRLWLIRRHLDDIFRFSLNEMFYWNLNAICLYISNCQQVRFGLGIGLAPSRPQTIGKSTEIYEGKMVLLCRIKFNKNMFVMVYVKATCECGDHLKES